MMETLSNAGLRLPTVPRTMVNMVVISHGNYDSMLVVIWISDAYQTIHTCGYRAMSAMCSLA